MGANNISLNTTTGSGSYRASLQQKQGLNSGIVGKRHDSMTLVKAGGSDAGQLSSVKKVSQIASNAVHGDAVASPKVNSSIKPFGAGNSAN